MVPRVNSISLVNPCIPIVFFNLDGAIPERKPGSIGYMCTLNLENQFQVNRTLLLAEDSGDLQNRKVMSEATAVAVWLHLTNILDYSAFRNLFYFAWKNNYSRTTSFPGPFPLENGTGGKKPWERG